MKHQCIKPGCSNSYEDNEVDAYYCPSCNTVRQQLARELDAKFNTVGQQPSGALAAYDAARGRNAFPSAGSLGIQGFK